MDRKSCQLTNQVSLVRDSTRDSSWFCMPVTKSIETFFAAVVESSLHHVRLHREEESARLSLPKALPRERMVSSAKSRRASGAPSKWSYGVGPPSLHKSPSPKFQKPVRGLHCLQISHRRRIQPPIRSSGSPPSRQAIEVFWREPSKYGRIFRFARNKFPGSHFVFSSRRRSKWTP